MYIANLPIYFAETNLENMFKDYGTVISTRILRKPDGISRGVGFSRMESKEKCERIIDQFNGKILPGNLQEAGSEMSFQENLYLKIYIFVCVFLTKLKHSIDIYLDMYSYLWHHLNVLILCECLYIISLMKI